MVGIGEISFDIFKVADRNIIRHDKSVNNKGEAGITIRNVTVAAGRCECITCVARALYKAVGQQIIRKGLRPTVFGRGYIIKLLGGVPRKIVVEVAAAHNIVAILVLALHILKQHSHLRTSYLVVSAVRGGMHVIKQQLFAALDLNSAHAVASIKIKEL